MYKKNIAIFLMIMVLSVIVPGCTGSTKNDALSFEVKGMVDKAGTYYLEDYKDKYVTINAKLDGEVTHLPAQDYTGVPVRAILSDAGIKQGASMLKVTASDDYVQVFDLSNVTSSDNMILINEDNTVRLVAKGYAGGYWVRYVKSIEVS